MIKSRKKPARGVGAGSIGLYLDGWSVANGVRRLRQFKIRTILAALLTKEGRGFIVSFFEVWRNTSP